MTTAQLTASEHNERLRDHILALAERRTWEASLGLSRSDISTATAELNAGAVEQIHVVGHGTSFATAQLVANWASSVAGIPAQAFHAFDYANYYGRHSLCPEETLVVGISCSGNTASTIQALERSREAGSQTILMTGRQECVGNAVAHHTIRTHADIEKRVVVAAYSVSHLFLAAAGYYLALALGALRTRIDADEFALLEGQFETMLDSLKVLPELFDTMEQLTTAVKSEAPGPFCVLGTGPNVGTATEGALKISEFSWNFGAAEELEDFAHGRFREVDSTNPLLVLAPSSATQMKTLDLLAGCAVSQTPAIVFTPTSSPAMEQLARAVITMPDVSEDLTPFLYIFPLWFYGWHLRNNENGIVGEKRHGLYAVDIDFGKHFNTDGSRRQPTE